MPVKVIKSIKPITVIKIIKKHILGYISYKLYDLLTGEVSGYTCSCKKGVITEVEYNIYKTHHTNLANIINKHGSNWWINWWGNAL